MTEKYSDALKALLSEKTPKLPQQNILNAVERMHDLADVFKTARDQFNSPLYIIDKNALTRESKRFMSSFGQYFDKFQPYFAMKSNNHPYIIKTMAENGYGIDVSSGAELRTAIMSGAQKIVFSGPAKTRKELTFALEHADKIIFLMDSENELAKLDNLTKEQNIHIRAGVRVTAHTNPLWRKFGIPISSLSSFIEKVARAENIDFCGIQFHSSWNLNPDNHCALIKSIGETLSALTDEYKKMIDFIDIGGGYWVEDGEWMLADTSPEHKIRKQLTDETTDPLDHRFLPACTIEEYAAAVAEAYDTYIRPNIDCELFAEPGRFISHHSMHLLLTVEDIKEPDIVITDGATNMLGWERYEMDYFPVVNISNPSLAEIPMHILGSLCTPHDVWGFAYFGEKIEMGDLLVIPSQGAYTYSLRQNFIKDIPLSVVYDGFTLKGLF